MDLVIMFILGMIAGAGLLIVIACVAFSTDMKDPKPKTKDEWRGLD